ncbi:ubiquitin-like domain-containing protein [Kineococcus glutinatus]|uniref:ubiquitin-like domain-containing protein n=1 Tax=Kineococcus glutinatus TaxID=1070872 RepID=UPI0031E7197E
MPGRIDVWNPVRLPSPRRRLTAALTGGSALVLVLGGTTAFTTLHKDVRVDVDGSSREVGTFSRTVADVLRDEGITVGAHDVVAPAPDTELREGQDVVVRYGRRLDLTVDGEQRTYWTTATTVQAALDDLGVRADGARLSASRSQPLGRQGLQLRVDTPKDVVVAADGAETPRTTTAADVAGLLAEAGVVLRPLDTVSAPTTAPVTAGLRVQVVRVDVTTSTEVQAIGHGSRTEETADLYVGERRVSVEGRDGSKTLTFEDETHDGVRVRHDLVGEHVDAEPVEEVVQVGTKPKPAPAPTGGGSVAGADGLNWAALAACESGGNPGIVSSSGRYHGLYQFSVSTWRAVGGSGLPSQASAAEQTYRAKLLYARAGAGQWPVCGKRL